MPQKHSIPVVCQLEPYEYRARARSFFLALLAGLAIFGSSMAQASVFGETLSVSPIGSRFSVEVASPGMTRETLTNCVRLPDAQSNDGIASLRGGSLSLAGSGAGARIVISHREPVFEPIFRFTLQDVCTTRLQRIYTLLMPEPAPVSPPRPLAREAARPAATTLPPRPAASAPRQTASAPARAGGAQVWATVQGESVASIAQALYPRDEGARRAFINGVMRGNPDLFEPGRHPAAVLPAGTELRIPDFGGVAARSSQARASAASDAGDSIRATTQTQAAASIPPQQAAAEPEPVAPETADQHRLLIDMGARDELAASDVDPTTSDEAMREARLVAAIDRSIDTQLELLERIRRLEQLQLSLRAQIEAAAANEAIALPSPATEASAPSDQLASSAQTPPPLRPVEEPIPERESVSPPTGDTSPLNWQNWAIIAGLLALVILLLIRRRSSRQEAAIDKDATPDVPSQTPIAASRTQHSNGTIAPHSQTQTQTQAKAQPTLSADEEPPETLPPPARLDLEWRPSSAGASIGPAGTTTGGQATLPPAILEEDDPEEHESAIELADIMMSFGRVHGAAETLEAFIESNPRQAITPWLKLMEVYHTAEMQREFDILATELNKTFNVRPVTWENFRADGTNVGSIESFAHIAARLQETWGTPQCQAYVDLLVRDNRQGTRQGFELGAIDDLLMLAGVLELHLGRYKPSTST